jgi:hypothetical protein
MNEVILAHLRKMRDEINNEAGDEPTDGLSDYDLGYQDALIDVIAWIRKQEGA